MRWQQRKISVLFFSQFGMYKPYYPNIGASYQNCNQNLLKSALPTVSNGHCRYLRTNLFFFFSRKTKSTYKWVVLMSALSFYTFPCKESNICRCLESPRWSGQLPYENFAADGQSCMPTSMTKEQLQKMEKLHYSLIEFH